jgi:hypothetical protein
MFDSFEEERPLREKLVEQEILEFLVGALSCSCGGTVLITFRISFHWEDL